MIAKPGQVPPVHVTECQCVECQAHRHLTPGDWRIVRFFADAQHYTARLALPDGSVARYPDLGQWQRLCALRREPRPYWPGLIEGARTLLALIEKREKPKRLELLRMDPADLAPPLEAVYG